LRGFASRGCLTQLLVLLCLSNVEGNLRCHTLDNALNCALRRSEMRKLRLVGTLPNHPVRNLRCHGRLRISHK
jgi:hypothetical protein